MIPRRTTPQWLLERLAAGDLAPDEASTVRRQLTSEGALDRLDALAEDDARLLQRHPPARVSASIRDRSTRDAAASGSWLRALAPATAVGLGLALAGPALVDDSIRRAVTTDTESTRLKGLTPSLRIYRRDAGGPRPLPAAELARAGDVLQLAYAGVGDRFGVVVSIDGAGQVTRHLPADGLDAARLSGPGEIRIDRSYTLDAAPAFERFVLVHAAAPFDVDLVLEAARRLGPSPAAALPIPPELEQVSVLLRKDAP